MHKPENGNVSPSDKLAPAATLSLRLQASWWRRGALAWSLAPVGLLYGLAVSVRRWLYRRQWLASVRFPVPVIVVGNLTVGGSGKTPSVVTLVDWLSDQGYRPGVVSRGYGGRVRGTQLVVCDSDPADCGDEPVLIARRTGCPVIVDVDRVRAVSHLLSNFRCDVVVSDDGLQHYRLARSIEVLVVDGLRRWGNGFCLPAGPLREPRARAKTVDLVVCNGNIPAAGEYRLNLRAGPPTMVRDPSTTSTASEWAGRTVHAVAGIGHPERFFRELRSMGLEIDAHTFPDHYRFSIEDFSFANHEPVLMTEKDAIKCAAFADSRMWFVPVTADLEDAFFNRLCMLLERNDRQKTT